MIRFILLLMFVFSNCVYGQDLLNDEYEIYGQGLADDEYQSCQFQLGIPEKYQKSILFLFKDDSIAQKIWGLPIKKWDSIKLSKSIKEKSKEPRKFKRLKIDTTEKVYFSPIFFKDSNEGYFFQIIYNKDLKKPIYLFLKARKINREWRIENYYDIFLSERNSSIRRVFLYPSYFRSRKFVVQNHRSIYLKCIILQKFITILYRNYNEGVY